MRILMIIDGLPGGGAEKVVLTLCHGMQRMGHDVSLFSLNAACAYPIPNGINYQQILDSCTRPWRKLTELNRRAAALDFAIMTEQRKKGDFDLFFSSLHKTDRIVSRCRTIATEKLWFCIHGVISVSYLGPRHGFSRWLKQNTLARLYNKKNIIAVSQAIAEDLQTCLGVRTKKQVVINNPFSVTEILIQAAKPCDRQGSDYLIHVGRLHPIKRHDRLIKAYALSGISAPLLLLGDGPESLIRQLKQLAKSLNVSDRVVFAGFHTNPFPLIKHAAMLVLSSDSEGFGNVLVEALLCGTPVVSTRCPGGPEEIMRKAGLDNALAELNIYSLAEKMYTTYHHPPVINPQLLTKYDITTICQQYLNLKK